MEVACCSPLMQEHSNALPLPPHPGLRVKTGVPCVTASMLYNATHGYSRVLLTQYVKRLMHDLRAIQFSGTWHFPRPRVGERVRVRGCPGAVHNPHPNPLPSQLPNGHKF
jgi:hypothetical protein